MKVWIPDAYASGQLGRLPSAIELAVFPDDPLSAPDLGEVEFLVPPHRPREVVAALAGMRRLRVVQTDSAGVEWLVDHLPRGATLCNARGVHDTATSEWVVAAILALTKRLPHAHDEQRRGRWRSYEPGELAGKTVLIVGYGSIGRAVAARLEPFGVRLVRVAGRARTGVHGASELPRLVPDADVVVLLVPLSDRTRGLVDERFLALMRPGSLLVNASRGALVDTTALLAALEQGRIQAALDVTDPEPLPDGHPLWTAPGALITPHVAGAGPGALPRAAALIRAQLLRHLEGQPLANVVRRPE
ncbi:MAG TPA: 2-hydroxyacid dehydrogenase [Solirubrobacteraceae bacterium]|nr:2-hydroxyacid dehydrogenase [Solirubrobacteraceae bacterium]